MRMFEHDSIAERNQFVVGEKRSGGSRYPDINGAVTEIAGNSVLSTYTRVSESNKDWGLCFRVRIKFVWIENQ
jgi:hypothetical protein